MANSNAPFGILPIAYLSGAPYNGAARTYYVPSGNSTALYFGDPVMLVASGTGSDAYGIPAVNIATAGATNLILGAFMGRANNAGQATVPLLQNASPYLPISTAAYIYVADDPTLLYKVQEDGGGGAIAYTAGGAGADLVAGTGSTYTNMSGWQLDSSTVDHTAASTTLQVRIIQLLQETDNALGLYAKWLIRINTGLHPFTTNAPS